MSDYVRAIRRDVPIPYYYQLMQLLREDIVAGVLKADTPIPSEHPTVDRSSTTRHGTWATAAHLS